MRGIPFGFGHHGRRGDGYLLLLLVSLAGQINRLPVKPPVTLGLMALQIVRAADALAPFASQWLATCTDSASIAR
jgi:hypothetical protein